MESAKPLGQFTKYTSLSVLGMLAISCYILADTFFVAQRLGTNGLAALNLAIPIYDFVHGVGLMLGIGGATKYSVCKSRGEHQEANMVYVNTLYLAAGFSLLFVLTGLFFSGPLIRLLGANEATFEMANTYLQVLLLFSPAFLLNDILLCFVRNDGNPQLSMAATVSGSLSNILLDYVFMFPLGMGIFGAVLATGLAPVIGILIMSPHWLKKSKGFHLVKAPLQAGNIRITCSLGFPSMLAQVSSGIVMIVFNSIILRLIGNTGVAAYGVIANISLVVIAVFTGIAQGIQPLVSVSHGQGNQKSQRLFLRYALILMAVLACVIYLVLFLFAGPIVQLFNSESSQSLQEIAEKGLKLYFTSVIFVGFNIIISMYFTSMEKALPAHIISLLRGLFLIVPAAFLFAALWGMTGVWLAFPITELVVAAIGLYLYLRYRRSPSDKPVPAR